MSAALESRSWIDDAIRDFPPLATIAETAKFLTISDREFHRLVAEGKIKTIRKSSVKHARVFVPRASVRAYLESLEK